MKLKKKHFTKEQRKQFIFEGIKSIDKLSIHLRNHVQRNKNVTHVNHKIHYLLHDPFTFVNAYTKISKNKEVMTKKYKDDKSMKNFVINNAINIAKKIKNGTYKFKLVKRTWVPRPGKKKRPIDVPIRSDRIVQKAIRGILETIYEPEFESWSISTKHLSNNYGFSPNKSTWLAVEKLKKESQRCNMVIEGDIVSAYNNVDHKILILILQERIKDKKFINLIKNLLISGIIDADKYEHTLTVTPQREIVSPLLFNIYLFGLDKFVYTDIIIPHEKSNIGKKKELKRFRTLRNVTPYNDIKRLKRYAIYVRYANDWVLALPCTRKEAEEIKQKISEFFLNQRKMQLDDVKTHISQVSKGCKFLGFEIRMLTDNIKKARSLLRPKNFKPVRIFRRTTSRMLTVEPDSNRILKRLKLEGFCNDKFEPKAKPRWLIFEDFQIVKKFSQIFRGIYNYYLPCERLIRLNRVSYILQYSCARTLSRRRDVNLRKTFGKYGKNLKITYIIKNTKKENKTRSVQFFTLTDLKKIYPTFS